MRFAERRALPLPVLPTTRAQPIWQLNAWSFWRLSSTHGIIATVVSRLLSFFLRAPRRPPSSCARVHEYQQKLSQLGRREDDRKTTTFELSCSTGFEAWKEGRARNFERYMRCLSAQSFDVERLDAVSTLACRRQKCLSRGIYAARRAMVVVIPVRQRSPA